MRIIFVFTLALLSLSFAACDRQSEQAATPTAAIKAYIEAIRKNDRGAMRGHLSKGTLEMIEKTAQAQNITSDEVLAQMSEQANAADQNAAAETRNEQIAGDAASVELRNAVTGEWDEIPLIKEDGRWKIALDKLMEEVLKEVPMEPEEDTQNQTPNQNSENSANRQSNQQSNSQSNK